MPRSACADLLPEASITALLNKLAADVIIPYNCSGVDYTWLAETFGVWRRAEFAWYMYGPDLRSANAHSKAVTCTDTMHVREQYELPDRHRLAGPHAHAHPDQQGLPKLAMASLVPWDPDVPYSRECPCACLPCARRCVNLGSMSSLRLMTPWFHAG